MDSVNWLLVHDGVFGTLAGTVLGAVLGFGSSWFMQWRQGSKERHIAKMQIASNLRHWANCILSEVCDTRTWIGSNAMAELATPISGISASRTRSLKFRSWSVISRTGFSSSFTRRMMRTGRSPRRLSMKRRRMRSTSSAAGRASSTETRSSSTTTSLVIYDGHATRFPNEPTTSCEVSTNGYAHMKGSEQLSTTISSRNSVTPSLSQPER